MFDLLIKNALIIDGSGSKGYKGEIGISGDKISAVAPDLKASAKRVIDAGGNVVCPGFIDAHGHSDFTLFVNNKGESKIRQGITTEVTGNCGFTAGPITKKHKDDLIYYLANTIVFSDEERENWEWKTQSEFLKHTAKDGLSFNVAPLVGQGMIRVGTVGFDDRIPEKEEMEEMKNMLRAELSEGFFGMSMAFSYEPGNYMKEEESVELCKVLKEYGGIYTVHLYDQGKKLVESVKQVIDIGKKSGCRVEISHLKAKYKVNWGKTAEAIRLIEKAKEEGLDIAFDVYPYEAYGSGLIDLMPPWVKKDGPRVMCEKLKEKDVREKVIHDMENGISGWETIMESEGWENLVQIASLRTEENKKYEGKTIAEISKQRNCSGYEAVTDLIIEEDASVKCIWFAMSEEEVINIMKHPDVLFGTDGRACATYGKLSKGAVHPRYYGTYPRILGHYVRERKALALEEAIRKSTSAPARHFKISERGEIKENYYADLVIFSPEKIKETSTFPSPHNYPEGIDFVIVNGEIVIEKGEHSGKLPGKILKISKKHSPASS